MPSPVIWEWVYGQTVRKNIEEVRARPDPDTGAYGSIYRYDVDKPSATATLSAKNLSRAEGDTERAKVYVQNTTYAYTMADGTTVTGIPFSYIDRLIDGSPYYEATVELVRTDV